MIRNDFMASHKSCVTVEKMQNNSTSLCQPSSCSFSFQEYNNVCVTLPSCPLPICLNSTHTCSSNSYCFDNTFILFLKNTSDCSTRPNLQCSGSTCLFVDFVIPSNGNSNNTSNNGSLFSSSYILYFIVPLIAVAILIPCCFLRLRGYYKNYKKRPIITSTCPTEIAYEEHVSNVSRSINQSSTPIESHRLSRLSLTANTPIESHRLSRLSVLSGTVPFSRALTRTLSHQSIQVINENPNGSGTVRVVNGFNANDTNHPIVSGSIGDQSFISVATIYASNPPEYSQEHLDIQRVV